MARTKQTGNKGGAAKPKRAEPARGVVARAGSGSGSGANAPLVFVRPMRGLRSHTDPAFKSVSIVQATESVVNVCSTGEDLFASTLSPFNVGPCALSWSFRDAQASFPDPVLAKNLENAWQYSKVYAEHVDPATGEPTEEWYHWARAGFLNPKAVRFPMGRGAKPLYSFGGFNADGTVKRWGYVEARFRIYAPLYASLVDGSVGYMELQARLEWHKRLTLLDYDGWNSEAHGLTLEQVMYHPGHKCGHGFVLAMMLTDDRVWDKPFRGDAGIADAIAAAERHKTPGQTRLSLKRSASSNDINATRRTSRPRRDFSGDVVRLAPTADGRQPQPPPVRRGEAVPPVFQQWARDNGYHDAAALSASRAEFGEAKYGQPLMTQDGRDSVEDAKDEIGDFFHYLQKAAMNGEDVSELVPYMEAAQALLAVATRTA